MLLYEHLASQLRTQIAQGALRAGERLPSIRQLARSYDVSTATAVQACLQLEREGLAQARPRSGYFVRAATPPAPMTRPSRRRTPGTINNPMLQNVLDMLARNDLLPLHSATPAPELLPQSALSASLSHCLRHSTSAALDYAPPQGHLELRRQIAQRYAQIGVAV